MLSHPCLRSCCLLRPRWSNCDCERSPDMSQCVEVFTLRRPLISLWLRLYCMAWPYGRELVCILDCVITIFTSKLVIISYVIFSLASGACPPAASSDEFVFHFCTWNKICKDFLISRYFISCPARACFCILLFLSTSVTLWLSLVTLSQR